MGMISKRFGEDKWRKVTADTLGQETNEEARLKKGQDTEMEGTVKRKEEDEK